MVVTGETAGTYSAELLPHHLKMIQDSAVTPEVAAERGYRSAESRADLKRCGFSDSQCLVPGLLIPIRGVNGDIVNYQLRPDSPRMSKGKALKYETPTGSRMALDVPSRARANLRNPAVPLFVTEGSRKADAGVSKGLCCILLVACGTGAAPTRTAERRRFLTGRWSLSMSVRSISCSTRTR